MSTETENVTPEQLAEAACFRAQTAMSTIDRAALLKAMREALNEEIDLITEFKQQQARGSAYATQRIEDQRRTAQTYWTAITSVAEKAGISSTEIGIPYPAA